MNIVELHPKPEDRLAAMRTALGYFGVHENQEKVLALLAAVLQYREGRIMMERDRPHLEALFGGEVFE